MNKIKTLIPDSIPEKYIELANSYIIKRRNHIENMIPVAQQLIEEYPVLKEHAEDLFGAILLHDCAKELPLEKQYQLAVAYRGKLDSYEEKLPALWHAPAAAQLAIEELNLSRGPLTDTISFHPTGNSPPGVLLQGLMIADYAERGRSYPGAEEIRNLIGKISLQELTLETLVKKINLCLQRKTLIHPRSISVYNELCA
ncbi:MAG: hypothetical protein ACLFN5_06750 [bacterium]